MVEIRELQESWVREYPDILDVSIFPVQPWLDIPELGSSVTVVHRQNPELAKLLATEMAGKFWCKRNELRPILVAIPDAIDQAMAFADGPVVFSDAADGNGSGSPGDSTAILKELLARRIEKPVYVPMVDPEAVAVLASVGVGKSITIKLGGKRDNICNHPLEVTGTVRRFSGGRFKLEGPSHKGHETDMGRAVVFQSYGISIVVMENSVHTADPALYRCVGLQPEDAKIVVVKSPTMFKAAYRDIAKKIIMVDAPGLSTARIETLPFKRIPRPMYPLDDIADADLLQNTP